MAIDSLGRRRMTRGVIAPVPAPSADRVGDVVSVEDGVGSVFVGGDGIACPTWAESGLGLETLSPACVRCDVVRRSDEGPGCSPPVPTLAGEGSSPAPVVLAGPGVPVRKCAGPTPAASGRGTVSAIVLGDVTEGAVVICRARISRSDIEFELNPKSSNSACDVGVRGRCWRSP